MAPSPCLIADTTAATSDTIRAIGALGQGPEAPRSGTDCRGLPFQVASAPTVIVLTPPRSADLRDVLEGRLRDGGVPQPDVLISRDPEVLDFARRRAGYLIHSLPWNTTYVLAAVTADSTASPPTVDEREALARDAVTADARGALAPFRWLTEVSCAASTSTRASSPRAVVGFPENDAIARQLAERIVSIASGGSRPSWLPRALARNASGGARISAIPRDSLVGALTSGQAAAVIIPISRDLTAPCGTRGNMPVPQGAIPLVDARDHIIVRRGSGAALLIDAGGALVFVKRGDQ